MAEVKISQLPAGDNPTGAESLEAVQGGISKSFTFNQIAGLVEVPADTDDLSEGTTNLYFTDARVYAEVKAILQQGTNVTITANDGAQTLTISASGGGGGGTWGAIGGNIGDQTDLQDQFDTKLNADPTIRTVTASHTLDATDLSNSSDGQDYIIFINVASVNDLTFPPNSSVAFPIGTIIGFRNIGAGQVTNVNGVGVTINAPLNAFKSAAQNAMWFAHKTATDTWYLNGELVI